MKFQPLDRTKTHFLLIDVQEKLFPLVEHPCPMMERIKILIQGLSLLNIGMTVTEQYPEGLGPTIEPLRSLLPKETPYFSKTTFSALKDPSVKNFVQNSGKEQWILAGIEAHVCVEQTAFDLLALGKEVTCVNDALSSRSIYDFSTSIARMRDNGVSITSTEALLFELIRDAKDPCFKEFSRLIR